MEKIIRIRIPANHSHTGEVAWAWKKVDACIADIVEALIAAGIYTSGCCCGHGEIVGNIILEDGRVITVEFPEWEQHGLSTVSER